MTRILFICHGNICRSPMAEFIFKDIINKKGLSDKFYIESAATSYEEIGNSVYPPTKKELAKHNINCTGKKSRKLIKDDFSKFDYLIAMDTNNITNIKREFGSQSLAKVTLLLDYTDTPGSISDPWYTRAFDITYQQILLGCEGLLTHLELN